MADTPDTNWTAQEQAYQDDIDQLPRCRCGAQLDEGSEELCDECMEDDAKWLPDEAGAGGAKWLLEHGFEHGYHAGEWVRSCSLANGDAVVFEVNDNLDHFEACFVFGADGSISREGASPQAAMQSLREALMEFAVAVQAAAELLRAR